MMETIHIGMTAVAIALEARVLWRQRHQFHPHARPKRYCGRHRATRA